MAIKLIKWCGGQNGRQQLSNASITWYVVENTFPFKNITTRVCINQKYWPTKQLKKYLCI